MSHQINGFIAEHDALVEAARAIPSARVCQLRMGFGFLPLSESLAPYNAPETDDAVFYRLTAQLETFAVEQSSKFPIAYIETDYFGGAGSQSAVAWKGGAAILGPIKTIDGSGKMTPLLEGAINQAMRALGAQRGAERDEFDALGLGMHRSNNDWMRGY